MIFPRCLFTGSGFRALREEDGRVFSHLPPVLVCIPLPTVLPPPRCHFVQGDGEWLKPSSKRKAFISTHSVPSKSSEHQPCSPSRAGSWRAGDGQDTDFICKVLLQHWGRRNSNQVHTEGLRGACCNHDSVACVQCSVLHGALLSVMKTLTHLLPQTTDKWFTISLIT